jgi:hypothetical protein
VKRLFFILMVVLWGAFIALAVASPETLSGAWQSTRDLWWPLQVLVWIVLLPWMIGLWVWQTDWSLGARSALVAVLAVGSSAASFPRR